MNLQCNGEAGCARASLGRREKGRWICSIASSSVEWTQGSCGYPSLAEWWPRQSGSVQQSAANAVAFSNFAGTLVAR